MWVSILAVREKAGLFIGCISMLIDLYCLLSVGLLSCCSIVIEFSLSVRGKQYLGQGKYLWMSQNVPCSPSLFLLFIQPASCILISPQSTALHTFLPLCIPSQVCFAILLIYILKMHGKHFMLIAPLLSGLFRPLSLSSFPVLLSLSSLLSWYVSCYMRARR